MQEAVKEWLILDEENIKFHMGNMMLLTEAQ